MSSPPTPYNFPVVLTEDGAQPTPPATILQQLLAVVASQVPGYTASLPGSLIEDVSSTDVAAISLIDQARVEVLNSLTPFSANQFLLNQLGQVYGLTLGTPTNTSVFVVFTGTVGYVINNGFLVGDGTNVYGVVAGGIIPTGGSVTLQAIALNTGSFAVPINTVNILVSSVPSTITLSVNNTAAGTPGGVAEIYYSFRQRVLQAGLAASVGTSRYVKTLLSNVTGVPGNLISVQQVSGGLKICVGGTGDEYSIAYAILQSIADPSALQGKTGGGTNVTVSVNDYPDTYSILYVSSPSQTITMTVTWNTVLTSFTGGAAFPALVQPPLAAYINSLAIGQVINVLEMNEIFQNAVEDLLDASLLTRLVFSVSINGTPTSPGAGTYAITGDAESWMTCATSGITVTQG